MEERISSKRGEGLRKKAQKSKHSPKNNTIAPRTRLKWPPPPCPLKLPINSWWGLRLFDERMNVSCGPIQMPRSALIDIQAGMKMNKRGVRPTLQSRSPIELNSP